MTRWMGIALLALTLCALALRVPDMSRRPMHNDEAVNALKLDGLWEKGVYHYDPNEYHGPLLYYAALPVIWLSGAKDFSQVTEGTLRLVPVLFGAALVVLLWLLADGLGRAGTLFAGVLTAFRRPWCSTAATSFMKPCWSASPSCCWPPAGATPGRGASGGPC